ncbi:site-specific DNA-methyltransferase [Pseudomonas aeruginosa]|uniref:site-specific DNA-methyltransferase n=2 Tax=Pseudomonas aeruginosa TaxID=287 RepID=UPI0015DD2C2D|nr:site-specific DNA-methyltransferase [Pseudomonas aeruginosa]MCU8978242.1 site-specific DNA-methyltransferase [Pseudomonas aeruginosa]MCU8984478.1 site-specific DNA-methyltransferase [Pseudomonas aeruginosa]MCU8990281.1 site-specific DNA-methyltransferase [Pseudomonas aeruginosa]MCU8997421.1 site-specific DNA-methyltransferase [Pseudomonas aeruginosa]MCU9003145.1 site-specific DNA-methyltransferase [Pseudomonas aeruginosa]
MTMAKQPDLKTVETIKHDDAKRKNIPSAEQQSFVQEPATPKQIRYPRNTDLDPQLVWRGKDEQDWSDLVVNAPPLYIQEKVHPKALIDELLRETREREHDAGQATADLFSDFNGIPKGADKTEFYQHDQNWTNRMILGDSLQVMASLAEREGLRGKVQCIYFDPPYGIKFNSNFQWSTTSRDVKDGKADHITREPEQVKAFRDTWRDGIHSYLTYLRDRLTVARDLLTDSGSIFVQIGDENVHRVRTLMDEVLGTENFVSSIVFAKTSSSTGDFLGPTFDYLLWYAKRKEMIKYRKVLLKKAPGQRGGTGYKSVQMHDLSRRRLTKAEIEAPEGLPSGARIYFRDNLTSQSVGRDKGEGAASWFGVNYEGRIIKPSLSVRWKTNEQGFDRLLKSYRVEASSGNNLGYIRFLDDYPVFELTDIWTDTLGQNQFGGAKTYVVQTALSAIERCVLMTTDPGDLVLDPTCGSGSTATVAEQWGRRWITVDTSRVALALARARIMGTRYPYYLLADSREGQLKEAEVSQNAPSSQAVHGNVRHGFVYERVPHITLKSIANNAEIDVIWEQWQTKLEPLREQLNVALRKSWQEWEIPREASKEWSELAKKHHAEWWHARISRQQEIDASIAAKAEFEYLYDKPYENKKAVRVAGPFTVESLSPHRTLGVDENDELIDQLQVSEPGADYAAKQSFPQLILTNLKTAGVQQAHKEDRISFTALTPWPGDLVCAEGRYLEGESEKRAAIFIGPEFGTVQRADLVAAAREAADAGFDVLIACAFNFEAHTTEFAKLGKLPVLKARMNADLHMAEDLKNTGKGNLFVIFGEPDIDLIPQGDGQMRVKVLGVDVFKPQTGEVISDGADGIACWFIDTDYNEESFFVRHAYFLGANDPYNSLKTTLKAEIDAEAWASLNSDTSRPFPKPKSGRIAVKVINHLGDEVMKVFKVS